MAVRDAHARMLREELVEGHDLVLQSDGHDAVYQPVILVQSQPLLADEIVSAREKGGSVSKSLRLEKR